ncbi:MAG: SDR family NAD(P)-dependent oxidoreductase [Cyclobacteriaceae bacterium]
MKFFNLSNKIAVVTGGGSGIGLAIAELFAQQGAEVFILELNKEASEEAVKTIGSTGGKAYAIPCNVSDQKEVAEIFSSILKEKNKIDILVNCAGIAHIGSLENTSEADFDKVFNVNVKGVYNCMKAVIVKMKESGGVILNIASIASSVGIADRFAYSMSKGAVLTMTLSVAKDYIKHNVRCNCISPARIHTPFVDGFIQKNYPGKEKEMLEKLSASQPIGRMGKPDEVASLALYLCSDEATFVTGSDYPIDGGFIRLNN